MSPRRKIDPGWKWDDNFNLSQGIQIGNAVYTSGQVAMDSDGNIVGEGDMKAQTRRSLENVKSVLEAGGASMEDVVKITVYLTDMSRLAETHEVRAEFFPDPPPASTGIEVSALAFPGLLIEIEAIAIKS
jgi:2-iminobutanoate/2-iminopropanoate deaminase